MSAAKKLGAAPAVDDITTAMASRYDPTTSRSAAAAAQPAKTRRSWLLPTDVADGLSAAADRIHHGSGGAVSKSDAQAALIRAGLAHESEIAAQLTAS
ncbi:MAG: hypothetical protein ACRDMV_06165 [Streptosporangiales bacterium]